MPVLPIKSDFMAISKLTLARAWNWLSTPLLAGLVIFQIGYSYGEPNHVVHLPWILRGIDPTLLVNDWFANTPASHPNGVHLMTWLARFVPLPMAILVLHVISVLLVVWAADRLVMHIFGDRRVLLIGLFLMLRWGTVALGNNTLWGNCLVPHNLAAPFCLLAFYLALKQKPLAAALTCAVATWVHIQLGAQTMLVIGLGLLLAWRRVGFGRVVAAGAIYLAIVAPTVLEQWRAHTGPSLINARDYLYLHGIFRQPHHLVPSSWAGAEYYRFFLVMALALAGGWGRWRERTHRTILTWTIIIFALGVIGTVFVEWIPVKLIIRLQLFRPWIFVKFFALLYAGRLLLSVVEERGWVAKVAALAILTIQNFALVGIAAALLFAARQNRRWIWGLGLFGAGIVSGIALVATTSQGIPMFWHSFGVSLRGLWLAPVTLALMTLLIWRYPRSLAGGLIGLLIAVRFVFGFAYFGYDRAPDDEYIQFSRLVKQRTPRDAVFITPPYRGGFQITAERAEVVNFKCTPMFEDGLLEWKRRLNDLAGATDLRCTGWEHCASALAGGYQKLQQEDFLRLARKYGAQYVVFLSHGERHLHWPEVVRLHEFTLYQVPPS